MNVNKKIVAGAIIGTIGVSTVFGARYMAADTCKNVVTNEVYNKMLNEVATTTTDEDTQGEGIEKEETVYAKADATGTVNQVIVSDWLKNFSKADTIEDQSDLTDIENVKGDEEFTTGEDGKVTWSANGNDIYYQGKTDKELPVNIKAEYTLDGNEITPADLVGKSGKLEIKYTYENTAKVAGSDIYTPFTVVAGTMLKTEKFSHVTAENAKVISDGDKYAVVGVAMPGLKESLDLSDDTNVPRTITIKADVTDYEPVTVLNVVTADLLNQVNLDDTDELDDLAGSMDKLSESSKKLVDGSQDLSDGINTLDGKTKEYTNAVGTLTKSLDAYIKGVGQVTNGVKQLYAKSGDLSKGVGELAKGANALNAGLTKAKAGADTLASSFDPLVNGTNSLKKGAASLNTALGQLEAGKEKENQAYATLATTVENNEKIIAALKAAGVDPTIVGMLEKNTAGQKQLAQGLQKSGAQIKAGLTQAAQGADQIDKGASSVAAGASKLKAGAVSLQSAMTKLEAGSKTLNAGAKTLNGGVGSLTKGVDALNKGAVQLDAANKKLTTSIPKLDSASEQFKAGVSKLNKGGKTLATGMKDFNDQGIQKLVNNVDGKFGDIIDKFDDIKEAGSKYTTFTEASADMKSSVKFIIEIGE